MNDIDGAYVSRKILEMSKRKKAGSGFSHPLQRLQARIHQQLCGGVWNSPLRLLDKSGEGRSDCNAG